LLLIDFQEVFIILYHRILKEFRELELRIQALQAQLLSFPDGKLICARNGSSYKWYQSNGHHKKYIPKKHQELAEQLAAKKYLTLLLEDLLNEKKALSYYLSYHQNHTPKAEQFLTAPSGSQELLLPFFTPLSQELTNWANAPFDSNISYPENQIHKTISGNWVRSKSEAMIDLFLYQNKIPFRYESPLQLGSVTLYPDFTIRHPQTGSFYYWEHFGKTEDRAYSQNVCSKLQLYLSYGIVPSIQLITTWKTKEHPLNSETIEKIISYYFL